MIIQLIMMMMTLLSNPIHDNDNPNDYHNVEDLKNFLTRWTSTLRMRASCKARCWLCRSWDLPLIRCSVYHHENQHCQHHDNHHHHDDQDNNHGNHQSHHSYHFSVQLQQKEDYEGAMALYSKFQVIAIIQKKSKINDQFYVKRQKSHFRQLVFNSLPHHTSSSQLQGLDDLKHHHQYHPHPYHHPQHHPHHRHHHPQHHPHIPVIIILILNNIIIIIIVIIFFLLQAKLCNVLVGKVWEQGAPTAMRKTPDSG